MGVEGIRQALQTLLFDRGWIRLAEGRALPVLHSDFVAVLPRRIIFVGEDGSWSVGRAHPHHLLI